MIMLLEEEIEGFKNFLDLSAEEIIKIFKESPALNAENIELLGNLLYEMGIHAKTNVNSRKAKNYLQKAVDIYLFIATR